MICHYCKAEHAHDFICYAMARAHGMPVNAPSESDDRFLVVHPDEQREVREALTGSKEKVQPFEPGDKTRAWVAGIIDEHPLIASLLYDIDLLPEQIKDERRYNYMLAVIGHMLQAAQSATPAIDMAQMVDRFLAWRLPKDFSPDCGISFKPIDHPDALTHLWPIGTNLFTADQAKAMLEHVTAPLQEMVNDALRYRWLQRQGCAKQGPGSEECYLDLNPRDMDAAIDAALDGTNHMEGKDG